MFTFDNVGNLLLLVVLGHYFDFDNNNKNKRLEEYNTIPNYSRYKLFNKVNIIHYDR